MTVLLVSASVVLTTLADTNRTGMTNTYCVYTVSRYYSWWWTVDLSETCRVLYQINLRNSAYCWLSLYECLRLYLLCIRLHVFVIMTANGKSTARFVLILISVSACIVKNGDILFWNIVNLCRWFLKVSVVAQLPLQIHWLWPTIKVTYGTKNSVTWVFLYFISGTKGKKKFKYMRRT
jgi:hypothetical protein